VVDWNGGFPVSIAKLVMLAHSRSQTRLTYMMMPKLQISTA
jgi:hypothetical protein